MRATRRSSCRMGRFWFASERTAALPDGLRIGFRQPDRAGTKRVQDHAPGDPDREVHRSEGMRHSSGHPLLSTSLWLKSENAVSSTCPSARRRLCAPYRPAPGNPHTLALLFSRDITKGRQRQSPDVLCVFVMIDTLRGRHPARILKPVWFQKPRAIRLWCGAYFLSGRESERRPAKVLINCLDCGREISSRATACPGCGWPVSELLTEAESAKGEPAWSLYPPAPPSIGDAREAEADEPPPLPRHPASQGGSRWDDLGPHPWRRFFARAVDTAVHGIATMSFGAALLFAVDSEGAQRVFSSFEGPGGAVLDQIATSYIALWLNAVFIGFTGTSLGKWLFGVRVLDANGRVLGFGTALRRELRVLFYGQAGALPLLSTVASIVAFTTLQRNGSTSWDREMKLQVVHRRQGTTQAILSIVGFLGLFAIAAGIRAAATR